ncbi:TetR/AcrR family transcriptional regulator [Catelliglobosispora koreensis]|uniref:TetR/AcrR family transcriptional regulator n=1 Tax=Catelliglobosispora koreensis TaxID=129052 RepID=UPI0003760D4F|nr:TetR family transcriptional regulator [Catelliglobosispora koreensis]
MGTQAEPRKLLSRERVLRTAIKLADESGLGAVTMRRLAEELGAEAMSLYYHVSNKDDVFDGMAELIGQEINEAAAGVSTHDGGWKAAVRQRILTAREVLLLHPWMPSLLSIRNTASASIIAHHDAIVGLMHDGGLSYDLIHHGLHALGSRALGFAQELFDPGKGPVSDETISAMAAGLPNIAAMLAEVAHDDPASTLGWCDDQTEFEFGLDLILDGLHHRSSATS